MNSRLGLLLASSSVAALLVSGSAPPAFAQFDINSSAGNVVINPPPPTYTAVVTNPNVSIGGSVINNGVVRSTGTHALVGITINNHATLVGGLTNNGVIASGLSDGIIITQATVGGGITNDASGIINADLAGILVQTVSTFAGGIANTGSIGGGGQGIFVSNVAQFGTGSAGGGISNSGMITGAGSGVRVFTVSDFSGGVSNSGTISVAGPAGIYVGDVSSFIGGITNTGTISGSTGILASNSGAVSIFDSGVIVGTGGTAVDLTGNAAGNSFTLGPGYSITGLVKGQGADTFQLGGTGSGSFNLSSFGSTQQYQGFSTFNVVGGNWTLTGANATAVPFSVSNATATIVGTFDDSSTTVSAGGILVVNGTLSDPTIDLGGTLTGAGTVGSTQINAGGTFAPGNGTPGSSMTIAGNLGFQSGAIYQVYVNPSTSSFASVSGSASLAGTVNASFSSGSYISKVYTILTADSVNGTFSGLTTVNLPSNFTASLSYDTADAYLDLTLNYTPPSAPSYTPLNGNQNNVASTLINYFNAHGSIPTAFGTLSASGLSHVNGEASTGASKGTFQLMTDFLELMLDPTAGGGNSVGSGATGFAPEQDASLPADVALAYAKALKAPPPQATPTFDQRWTAWGSAFGGASFTNGNAALGTNNVTATDYGFAAGMETHLTPDTVYGFGLAGGGTNWNLAQGLGSGRSDSFQAGLYAKTHAGPAYLSAALAFANHWFSTDRIALGDQLQANFTGQSYAARLEGGYRYAVPITGAIVGVTPYAALQAQDFHTPSYNETDLTGGGFGLSYGSMNGTDTRSELGARFDNQQIVNGMPLILRGRLAWAHDWYTNPSALNAAFETLPGTNFTVNGAALPKNSALTTAAAELHLTASWTAIAKFDGAFGSGSQTYGGTGTLKYSW